MKKTVKAPLEESAKKSNARCRAYYLAHRKEVAKRMKAYYAKHQEECKARATTLYHANRKEIDMKRRAYRLAHREELRAYKRLKKYGLSELGFNDLIKKQSGACAICREKTWGCRGPQVDHDHITGRVRGILCQRCNLVLGAMKDDYNIARAIIVYLEGAS